MSLTVAQIIGILNLLLGAGGLGLWLRYRVQIRELLGKQGKEKREDDRVDFTLILDEVKQQRDEAWDRERDRDRRIEQMEAEIQGLRLARDLDPFPNWVVDLNKRYLYVNREFERVFLEPHSQSYRDIIGKTHAEFWPREFCETLEKLDIAAKSRPDGTARATTTVAIAGVGLVQVTVHKFPIRFKPAGVIVAYAGFITDLIPETEKLDDHPH